jgi:hypothetical protein
MLHELRVGWRTFVGNTWVWVIVLQFLVLNAAFDGGVDVLGPGIAQRTIGRTAWGLVLGAQTLGSLLGGLLAAHWQARRAMFAGVAACTVFAGRAERVAAGIQRPPLTSRSAPVV